jgi:hypothetical protein
VFLHAAIRGHYTFNSAYDIVRNLLAFHLAGLFVGVFLTGRSWFCSCRRHEHGIGKAVKSMRASADGNRPRRPARPIGEFERFGEKIDAARSDTLVSVLKIRSEAATLAAGGISQEEFRLRWDELKQRIRRIAP